MLEFNRICVLQQILAHHLTFWRRCLIEICLLISILITEKSRLRICINISVKSRYESVAQSHFSMNWSGVGKRWFAQKAVELDLSWTWRKSNKIVMNILIWWLIKRTAISYKMPTSIEKKIVRSCIGLWTKITSSSKMGRFCIEHLICKSAYSLKTPFRIKLFA